MTEIIEEETPTIETDYNAIFYIIILSREIVR